MKSPFKARIGLIAALSVAVAGALVAQPRAVFEPLMVDAGLVSRGDLSEHVFQILNEGDEPLELVEVKPACGCTVVDYDRTIAPGESGRLVATLNTRSLRGPISRSVQVYTNDAANAQVSLVIKANVKAYVDSEPGYARFLAVLGQGSETVRQTVFSEEGDELVVTGVTSPYPFIKASAHEAAEEERLAGRAGRQWIVEMSLGEDAPEGAFADFIEVKVDHAHLDRLRIPVSGFIQPVVAVLPRVADFGRRELSDSHTAILEVKNLGKPDVTLGQVETTVTGLRPEIEVVKEGRLFRLRLTLDPGMPKGAFSGTLTIPTSSADQPRVTIDVRGTIL